MVNKAEEAGLENKLLLIGGGGHCHSVLDSVIASNEYDEIGIVDKSGSGSCLGVSVMGTDDDIPELVKDGWNCAIVTVGSIGNTKVRRRLFEMVRKLGLRMPSVVDPTAIIAKGVKINNGCFVGKRAVINMGVSISDSSIINTGSIIEHDCEIGAFVHISPGAVLCGQVKVGQDAHVGAGSVVRQGLVIGHSALIGAGSVVVKNIPDNVKVYGNPCRVVD